MPNNYQHTFLTYVHTFPALCFHGTSTNGSPRSFWCAEFQAPTGSARSCQLLFVRAEEESNHPNRHPPSRKKAKAKTNKSQFSRTVTPERRRCEHTGLSVTTVPGQRIAAEKEKTSTMVRLSVSIELIGVRKEEIHSAESIGIIHSI